MKNTLRIIFSLAIVGISTHQSKAQVDFDSFLEAGVSDANRLLELYMEPAFVGLGFGMNSGWYNTAKPHKFLGFDITANVSLAKIPTANEFFTFNNSEFTNVFYAGGNSVEMPTIFGPNLGADDLPQMSFRDFDDVDNDGDTMEELIRISALTGAGIDEDLPFNAVPVPMAQIGIGIFKGAELKIRYIPEQNFDDEFNIKLLGLGLMYDIKQWLPAEKLLPFDISVFAGFTNLTSQVIIDADLDQLAELKSSSLTFQGVLSKKIAMFTPFVGVGYATANTDFSILGNFTTESENLTDPIAFSYKNSGLRANVGLRIKLLFLTITGEYAMQEYNTITAGVGFSFR